MPAKAGIRTTPVITRESGDPVFQSSSAYWIVRLRGR